jgi:non-ribosomal peptide synthetase component F/NRPS condensation-like uncharacterized protein
MTTQTGPLHPDPATEPAPPRLRSHGERVAPLSFAQQRLWLIDASAPGSATYNVPLLMRWLEPVDIACLRRALTDVVAAHEALRTTYELRGDHPVQVVREPAPVQIEVVDLGSDGDAGSVMLAEATERAREPFDLACGPLVRCRVWRGVSGGDRVLLLVHHIAIDGWSLAVLFEDLSAAYQTALSGRPRHASRPRVRYTDFARWDRELFDTPAMRRLLARRLQELLGTDADLTLPGARARPPRPEGDRPGRQHVVALPDGMWADVQRVARSLGATPFVVLLAAFEAVLWLRSGREEFVVGAVTANRSHPDLERIVGYFVGIVPLRCRVRPGWSFGELCANSTSEAFRSLTYQRIPYDQLLAAGAAPPDGHRRLTVNVGFALQNMPTPDIAAPRWAEPELLSTATAKFDLLLIVEQRAAGPVCVLEYDTDRYPAELAESLAADFVTNLSAWLGDVEAPLRREPPTAPAVAVPPAVPLAPAPKPVPGPRNAAAELALAVELFSESLAEVGRNARSGRSARLGPESNFFSLGGNSMLAVSMLARARRVRRVSASPGEFLAEPTVAGLARLLGARTGAPVDVAVRGGSAVDRYPATPTQQRFWTIDRIPSLRTSYQVPIVLELDGPVDREALTRASDLVLSRHPALRSRFELDRTLRRVFVRTDGAPARTIRTDAAGWDDSVLRRHLASACWSGFDLATGPVARAEILDLGEHTLLVLVLHHIVADGWSQQLLLDQLAEAYRAEVAGRPVRLPDPVHPLLVTGPPGDDNGSAGGGGVDWTARTVARLSGAPTDVRLPHDRPRPGVPCTRGATVSVDLPAQVTAALGAVGAALSCSTFMMAGALLGVTLARRGDQRDFLFAFPWAGRDGEDSAHAVGMFVETLVLRVDLRAVRTWRDLLFRVRESSTAAYRAANVPFDRLAAALHPGRDLSRPPVTPVYVTVRDGTLGAPLFGPEVRTHQVPLEPLYVKYELELTAVHRTDRLRLELAYAVELFDADTIDRLAGQLVDAAADLVTDLDTHPLGSPS